MQNKWTWAPGLGTSSRSAITFISRGAEISGVKFSSSQNSVIWYWGSPSTKYTQRTRASSCEGSSSYISPQKLAFCKNRTNWSISQCVQRPPSLFKKIYGIGLQSYDHDFLLAFPLKLWQGWKSPSNSCSDFPILIFSCSLWFTSIKIAKAFSQRLFWFRSIRVFKKPREAGKWWTE